MKDPINWTGDEVITMSAKLSFGYGNMMKFQVIDQSIKSSIESNFPSYHTWTNSGVEAEILQPGKDWQKGKLKLIVSYRVEFTPDKVPGSESPLDDLRSHLDV